MTNKELVLAAYSAVFGDKDVAAIDRYWSPSYIQHNPTTPNGLDALKGLVGSLDQSFTWEPGIVMADGDFVMLQSRFSGIGPTPAIRVDIVRVEDGKLAEHWDVFQDEVTETVSGNPMLTPRE